MKSFTVLKAKLIREILYSTCTFFITIAHVLTKYSPAPIILQLQSSPSRSPDKSRDASRASGDRAGAAATFLLEFTGKTSALERNKRTEAPVDPVAPTASARE